MQIVIHIDEEDYKIMQHNVAVDNPLCPLSQEEIVTKIANGIPLPKGHVRLIDADERRKEIDEEDRWVVDLAETIVEADKEE